MTDRNNVILATGAHDGSIKFWHAANASCTHTIAPTQVEPQVNTLLTTPDKQYLAAGGHLNIRLFDPQFTNSNNVLSTFSGHLSNITGLVFQRESRWFATSSEDGTIKIWDPRVSGVQREFVCKSPLTAIILHSNQCELIA